MSENSLHFNELLLKNSQYGQILAAQLRTLDSLVDEVQEKKVSFL